MPLQWERSSWCCRWPLAATSRLASHGSSNIVFPDTFGLTKSCPNRARGHDSFLLPAGPGPGLFQLCRSRRKEMRVLLRQRLPQPSLRKSDCEEWRISPLGASAARSAPRAGRGAGEMHLRTGKSQSNNPESATAANCFYLVNCFSCPWMRRRNNLFHFSAAKSVPSHCRSGNKWWEGLASTNSLPRSIWSHCDFVLGPQIQLRKRNRLEIRLIIRSS